MSDNYLLLTPAMLTLIQNPSVIEYIDSDACEAFIYEVMSATRQKLIIFLDTDKEDLNNDDIDLITIALTQASITKDLDSDSIRTLRALANIEEPEYYNDSALPYDEMTFEEDAIDVDFSDRMESFR